MNSLKKFFNRFGEIKNLREMAEDLNPPMTKNSRDKVSVLNRALIVMLCSHIEGYLEDIVIEFVGELCKNGIPAERVPGKLKVTHMMEHLKKLQYEENSIKQLFTDYNKLWIDNQILRQGDLDGKRVVLGFSSPGSKKIEDLLKKIGLIGAIEQIPDILKRDLDAIVKRRHDIAHGNLESTVASADVVRYCGSASELAKRINKIIRNYLKQITNN